MLLLAVFSFDLLVAYLTVNGDELDTRVPAAGPRFNDCFNPA